MLVFSIVRAFVPPGIIVTFLIPHASSGRTLKRFVINQLHAAD